MILLNGEKIKVEHFPDGTQRLRLPRVSSLNGVDITWKYENEEELSTLIFVKKHLADKLAIENVNLILSYIPNARMDRTYNYTEVFTLKYFCDVINWLNFKSVWVLDPHSNVSTALLDRVKEVAVADIVSNIALKHLPSNCVLYFPDQGAAKKYSDMFDRPYVYGEKKRDWNTGKIKGLTVRTNGIDIENKTILMVDDIISFGGSLHYSALALKELGVDKIFAYATHTENSILDKEKGTLIKDLEDGTVEKLFTTDSLFTREHEKIEVLEV